mgnify:CR=1 FL=1
MKKGRDLQAIAQEISTTQALKEDLVFPGEILNLSPDGQTLQTYPPAPVGTGYFPEPKEDGFKGKLSDIAHAGLSRRLEIPKGYYDKMRREQPELLAQNVNTWFKESGPHLVRALNHPDGSPPTCRAILSERYKFIDNAPVMEKLFPILREQDGMEVVSCEITPTKFYLKARFPELQREIGLNDAVQSGVVISNSEVGYGSTEVSMLIFRLRCLNGMILADKEFTQRRVHIGATLETDDNFRIIASNETLRLRDDAFFAGLADIVRAAADPDVFHSAAAALQDAADQKIDGTIQGAVENVTKRFLLTEAEGESVLDNLIRDGDYSKWGMANAVTRTANETESYDRATELERLGGKVIELAENEWLKLAA